MKKLIIFMVFFIFLSAIVEMFIGFHMILWKEIILKVLWGLGGVVFSELF